MTKKEFLKELNNTCNHRVLLYEALKLTSGPVVELGSGHGSTPYLRQYCQDKKRKFSSYENDPDWAKQTGSTLINDWTELYPLDKIGVLFLDHAPGERRKEDLRLYKDDADIIVIHDSEPVGAGNYQVRPLFKQFKYVVDLKSSGAWATMVSNTIDFTNLVGMVYGEYEIIAHED